jgi:hypothetical protein
VTTILRALEIFAERPLLSLHDDPVVLFSAVLSTVKFEAD